MDTSVHLYRYDLSGGAAKSMGPLLLGRNVEGIWHTSIVVFGSEFYFGGGESVVKSKPGSTRFGTPVHQELLGDTSVRGNEFDEWITAQRQGKFGADDYDLLKNNCNDFTQAASQFLLGKDIPEDVRKMIPDLMATPLGALLGPVLQNAAGGTKTQK